MVPLIGTEMKEDSCTDVPMLTSRNKNLLFTARPITPNDSANLCAREYLLGLRHTHTQPSYRPSNARGGQTLGHASEAQGTKVYMRGKSSHFTL